jgi:AraC-like DNA-binding protein
MADSRAAQVKRSAVHVKSPRRARVSAPGRHVVHGYLERDALPAHQSPDAVVVRSASPPRVLHAWALGRLDLCLFEGTDVDVQQHHRVPAGDGLVVGYVVDGRVSLSQNGRTVHLRSGRFALYDGATPFRIRARGHHRYLVLRIPLSYLGLRVQDCAHLAATDLNQQPSSAVLAALLGALSTQDATPADAAAEHLAHAVPACLHAVVADARLVRDAPRSVALFQQLAASVEEHLADHELSAASLARHHFLSERYVREVFSHNGTTVSAFVRERRLERIRHELLDPRNRSTPLAAVAARWGFADASTFSREFTRQHGMNPSTYRRRTSS